MDVFRGNHGDSKTMSSDQGNSSCDLENPGDLVNFRGDLEHPDNKHQSDFDAAKKPTVLRNKSLNHNDTKDDDDDVTNRSYYSNDDCFLDNEE